MKPRRGRPPKPRPLATMISEKGEQGECSKVGGEGSNGGISPLVGAGGVEQCNGVGEKEGRDLGYLPIFPRDSEIYWADEAIGMGCVMPDVATSTRFAALQSSDALESPSLIDAPILYGMQDGLGDHPGSLPAGGQKFEGKPGSTAYCSHDPRDLKHQGSK
ncbi:hypothetical protein Dimus_001870 [Dionaea muscipula]